MKNQQPIGIFDSGIGGLTVANAVSRYLPNESIIYFGDTVHLPYGDKSAEAIRQYSVGITHFLLEQGCKMVVVACNTAASAAYDTLKSYFADRVLLVDVVDPLVEEVSQHNFKKAGVIATKATISSGIYERKLKEALPQAEIVSLATPLLVPMIEEGFFNNNISHTVLEQYLSRPEFEGIEALLLSCTHYPLIRKEIEAYFGGKVQVFDSTIPVARRVEELLRERGLLSPARVLANRFYVSDYTESFEKTTKLFYTEDINLAHLNIWG